MNSKKRMRNNFFYMFLYIFFLCIFSLFRSNLNDQAIKVEKTIPILTMAEQSTNFFSENFNNFLDFFYSKKYLLNKISLLEEELDSIKNENITKTSEMVNNKDVIVSEKIFQDFTSIYDSLVLDKGSKDGVELGNIVFDSEYNAIGKIQKVNEKNSIAILFSKSGERVEGVVYENKVETYINHSEHSDLQDLETENSSSNEFVDENKNNLELENYHNNIGILVDLYGYGGGDFISNVPGNIKISRGSKVYLASDESKYLGEIVNIEKEEASYYQKLFIRGYYNTRINIHFYIEKQ